jgi:hypothetical protein
LRAEVAIALIRTLREAANTPEDWRAVLDFFDKLPPELKDEAEFIEHRAFALSGAKDYLGSIAALEGLIAKAGATPERLGLLGGRYRRLMNAATSDGERGRLRNLAIGAYARGMELDLNEYYCSSNLPRLYRVRGKKDDERRAQSTLNQVIIACERARQRGSSDEWLNATLLTAAFDAGDADKAEELADEIDAAGTAPYKLEVIVRDLEWSASQVSDPQSRGRLLAVVGRFKAVLNGGSS